MRSAEIIIIGAGAAGLIAALELSKAGKKVVVLEAQELAGGRMLPVNDPLFGQAVQAGAEFIHGDLPLTFSLLKDAGLSYYALSGESWASEDGELKQQEGFIENWQLLVDKLKKLDKDMSLSEFLHTFFAEDEFKDFRTSVSAYAEGYDAANANEVSVLSLRKEWLSESENQYRIEGGYGKLIDYLVSECRNHGSEFVFSAVAKKIRWQKEKVEVETEDGLLFTSGRLLVTLPVALLNLPESDAAALTFIPRIDEHLAHAKDIGSGVVIKFLLQFDEAFWDTRAPELGFLFSKATVPTWWTQLPEKTNLLTGWLAGPKALNFMQETNESLLDTAIASLSEIFNIDRQILKNKLVTWHITNWGVKPFSRMAYAYTKANQEQASAQLGKPIENTIYFAGEAIYEGTASGTVEAALISGQKAARKMLD